MSAFFRKYRTVILIISVVIAAAVYFIADPAGSVYFPKCPVYTVTGWECPGCGSQRAIHALLHGRIAAAWGFNPAAVIAIPYMLLLIFLDTRYGRKRFPAVRRSLMGRPAGWIVVGLFILWFVGRNLT